MSQNPFEALGGGGFDMNALLQQAQQMQEQLSAAQEQLAETVIDGSVAGVRVRISGVGDLVGIDIAPGTVDGGDAESLADLSDLIVAAFREAKTRADAQAQSALGPLAGGLGGLGGGDGAGGALPSPGQLGF